MKLKTLVFIFTLTVMFVLAHAAGAGDSPGSVTIDSCSCNGIDYSVSVSFSDKDGVSKLTVDIGDTEVCSDEPDCKSGKFRCSGAINGKAKPSCTIEVTITDSKGNTTSTSKTCYP